jgi:hypothetical protein
MLGYRPLAALILAAVCTTGCSSPPGQQKAIEAAQNVQNDMNRGERIPRTANPELAQQIMGREPDGVEKRGELEILYYKIRGAVQGETLRLAFRSGTLFSKDIVRMGEGQ